MTDRTSVESGKAEYTAEKSLDLNEKGLPEDADITLQEEEPENSPIEAVRAAVPITDDPTLPVITFRFWLLSFLFTAFGGVITQYYFFRTASGGYSIFFVNLVTYSLGKFLARVLPTNSFSIGSQTFSLNSGPFNIKEHALIGIAVSTGSSAAYAIDILAATDLFLGFRINMLGSMILIITTQCCGYGMAGLLRRYLVYPAQMVWWPNLVQVAFYNTLHNTDDYKRIRLARGWSYMKFFWVVAGVTFLYQLLPQWIAPILIYMDWICWIKPFDMNFWAMFNSMTGAGIGTISLDWTSIGGTTLYYPLAAQLCQYAGMIFNYWIIFPIMWMNNTLGVKTIGIPFSSRLYFESNGTRFDINKFLTADFSLDDAKYDAGPKANMAPMYALGFMVSFIALAGCCSHVAFFHGAEIWAQWKQAIGNKEEDIHTKMMKVYPEVPHSWYAIFYVIMAIAAAVACEKYGTQLPWWGLFLALALGFVLTLPIGVMIAVTGWGPGLNVITELVIGYILPGKPIANMTFKCYGYMAMYQCHLLMGDLKLGHYMKLPPRALFVAQIWGSVVGAFFNYFTMIVIINSQRSFLDKTKDDPNGLWTGNRVDIFWGSGLIYGALAPARMFALDGKYWFVYIGFLIGFIFPGIQWVLSKKYPTVPWAKFNIALFAGGMGAFPSGYTQYILSGLIVCLIVRWYLATYHKNWWKKYIFILSAALDTGAAFTGLLIFLFLGGGISKAMSVDIPSWWGNYYTDDPQYPNYPYKRVNRCGSAKNQWESGTEL